MPSSHYKLSLEACFYLGLSTNSVVYQWREELENTWNAECQCALKVRICVLNTLFLTNRLLHLACYKSNRFNDGTTFIFNFLLCSF